MATLNRKESPAFLSVNDIYHGDATKLLGHIAPESISLAVWSPPYYVGKEYEKNLSFEAWKSLLSRAIELHFDAIKKGGFMAINIADILCFKDESMPKIMAENVSRRTIELSREAALAAQRAHPNWNRQQLAKHLGCSEQTIDRRINGNNTRGGKTQAQTRVFLVGDVIEKAAAAAGFYLYDRRIWVKDAAWENSRWHTISYRAVDEFEYLYVFWKPGITKVDRNRLHREEWAAWGSRAVWNIPSVRSNADHESKFPIELPRRAIRLFTDPEETVLDCFMGSGTTALAAISEGRKYIGIEKEKRSAQMAKQAIINANFNLFNKKPAKK